MGRRTNISQPMVLDVMLSPLTERADIVPSDTTEQWYYAGVDAYSPNRMTNPLFLSPSVEVYDADTERTYVATFASVTWQELNESDGTWGDVITNTDEDVTKPYVIYNDGRIKVNKNVPYSQSTTLLCTMEYEDPRDATVTYTTTKTITLATNRDATILFPVVSMVVMQSGIVIDHSTVAYNPFKDLSSVYTISAEVKQGDSDITATSSIMWYACDDTHTTETLIDAKTSDNLPVFLSYVSGQGTPTLTLDILYANRITIIARVYDTANGVLYPTRAYRTIRWDELKADCFAYSPNSADVRYMTPKKDFDTIVNIKGATLTDVQKRAWFAFDWKMRGASSSSVTSLGFSPTMTLSREQLLANRTTLVYFDAYYLANYDRVTYGGEDVTYNGEIVVAQTIG